MARFVMAGPSEYLAITGWGIDDVKLAKKAWVFAGQRCSKFDISPVKYEFYAEAMTSDKLAFHLPVVFTVGPDINNLRRFEEYMTPDVDADNNLLLYVKNIDLHDSHASNNRVKQLVLEAIERETRVLAASMTLEEISQRSRKFIGEMPNQVQLYLNKFGLCIYQADIKQPISHPDHTANTSEGVSAAASCQAQARRMARFMVAGASEYLAITGWGVDDVKLAKKAWVFPGQKCIKFDVTPVSYDIDVQAMSSEKLPFRLPAAYTIGPSPKIKRSTVLLLYAKLIAPLHNKSLNHVINLVKGVIEGETRVLASSMTMEEIFQGTKKFKEEVFDQVQLALKKFGLYIYSSNVKQLVDDPDPPGNEYFSFLGQKKQAEVESKAKVAEAEAQMKGEIGAKEREGLTLQNAAKVDAETKVLSVRQQGVGCKEEIKVKADVEVYENEREAEIAAAQAGLAVKKALLDKQSKLAEVEAVKAVAIREAELQLEVERKNALRLTEKLKAEKLSKATVQYETQVQDSNAALYNRQMAADATLFEQVKAAEARKAQAGAKFFEQKMAEDARLYAKQREAEALARVGKAKAKFVASMLQELGGDHDALRDNLMIDGGVYEEMARINASAMSGIQPKISVWSNEGGGDGADAGASAGAMLADVCNMLPPFLIQGNLTNGAV
uniref:Flotillin-like n=1 Tax=Oryza punctata TaxID=4537 RepID=A0A0E0M8W1_ORYPU